MFQAQIKYAEAYRQIRLDVLRGRITVEQAKTWIRGRGVVTQIMLEKEMETDWYKKQVTARADRDIPIMNDNEEEN